MQLAVAGSAPGEERRNTRTSLEQTGWFPLALTELLRRKRHRGTLNSEGTQAYLLQQRVTLERNEYMRVSTSPQSVSAPKSAQDVHKTLSARAGRLLPHRPWHYFPPQRLAARCANDMLLMPKDAAEGPHSPCLGNRPW